VTCEITIEVPGLGKRIYRAALDVDYTDFAAFVVRAMQEQLGNKIKEIREDAYNEGWRDAKAKRAKKKWFPLTMSFRYRVRS